MSYLKDYLVKGYAAFIVDIAVFIQGITIGGEDLMIHVVTKSFTIPTNFTESEAYAQVTPTATTTFTVKKNESIEVGTIEFTIGSHIGVFTSSADVTFISGDRLQIVNQATADVTLANISLTIRGNL